MSVVPAPSPQNWTITPVRDPAGNGAVVVEIKGVTGSYVAFVAPELAEDLARGLAEAARTARSGIVTAPAGALPPARLSPLERLAQRP